MLSMENIKFKRFHYFFDSSNYSCIKLIVLLTIIFNKNQGNMLVNGLRGTVMMSSHHHMSSYTDSSLITNSIQRRNTNSNNNNNYNTNLGFNNNSNNINNNYIHSDNNNNNNNNNNNVNSMNIMTDSSSSCQTVCVCKWKGGKQTVECIDRALITIPDIDGSTQVLDMSGNNLQILPHEQFKRANLLNLQKLYLRNCRIGQIDSDAFKGLTNLVELDLSQNLLTSVPSQTLVFTPSLRDLILASNPIQKIESHTFQNIPSLHKLDLSHCDIQSIAPQAFEGLDSLLMLKLNGNKLSELRPRTVETLSKLHGVELHDNPWMCDCRLRAAKIWLTEKNIPYPVAPICSGGPERVIDRTFADLQIDDFACRPEILPTNRYVESTTGENATIICRTSAVPTAIVKWYWNGKSLANGSVFSTYQRVYIYEDGQFEKRSKLVLTNSQETDSSEFYCVAENRAGTAEANFTLHVSMRTAGMASLGSGQIVGLSAALVILILFILLIILFLLVRLRRTPFIESKTPNHLEVITAVNQQNAGNCKQPPSSSNSMSTLQTGNGGLPTGIDMNALDQKIIISNGESKQTNPVQKPPRLTDLPYSSGNYENNGLNSGSFISPTTSTGNNPDLINDTKRFGSGDFADLKIPIILTAKDCHDPTSVLAVSTTSGEYSRAGGCDSLYPSGLWETVTTSTSTDSPHHIDDLYLKRATSTTLSGYNSYTDKTPIIDNTQLYDMQDRSIANEFFSKTFPRTHFGPLSTASSSTICAGANSTTSTTTTLSSSIGCAVNESAGGVNFSGGYPSDYGLPLVPGAEQQLQHNPLHYHQQQQQQQQQHNQLFNNNNSFNSNNNNNNTSNGRLNSNSILSSSPVTSTSTSLATSTNTSAILPNGMPINAKTIRVWQKGGVPVLPPVTALKRALTSSSRNSPDEGYQEGCGTDV